MNIQQLTQNDIGRKVVYTSFNTKEVGVITSWNELYVFVRYGNKTFSEATYPEDLQFEL